MVKRLYKTSIIIWTEQDPSDLELEDLAREATSGLAYCSKMHSELQDPAVDADWDGSEFFGSLEEEEEGTPVPCSSSSQTPPVNQKGTPS